MDYITLRNVKRIPAITTPIVTKTAHTRLIVDKLLEKLGIKIRTRANLEISCMVRINGYTPTYHGRRNVEAAYRRLLNRAEDSPELTFYKEILEKTGVEVIGFDEFIEAITKYVDMLK